MLVIGLSGGIASGKNFIADIFAQNGAAVFDADAQTHELMHSDESVISKIKEEFPQSYINDKISRSELSKIIFANKDSYQEKLEILEKIIHPRVRENYDEFLKKAQESGQKLVVLNIPLLLETKSYGCDKIIAIITTKETQKERFLHRAQVRNPQNFLENKESLESKFEQIFAKQISSDKRKELADFVINNDGSKDEAKQQVKEIIAKIL